MKKAAIQKAVAADELLVYQENPRATYGYGHNRKWLVRVVEEITTSTVIATPNERSGGSYHQRLTTLEKYEGLYMPKDFRGRSKKPGWIIEFVRPESDADKAFFVSNEQVPVGRRTFAKSGQLIGTKADFAVQIEAKLADTNEKSAQEQAWATEMAMTLPEDVDLEVRQRDVYLELGRSWRFSGGDQEAEGIADFLSGFDAEAEVQGLFEINSGADAMQVAALLIDADDGEIFLQPRTIRRYLQYLQSGLVSRKVSVIRDEQVIRDGLRAYRERAEVAA